MSRFGDVSFDARTSRRFKSCSNKVGNASVTSVTTIGFSLDERCERMMPETPARADVGHLIKTYLFVVLACH